MNPNFWHDLLTVVSIGLIFGIPLGQVMRHLPEGLTQRERRKLGRPHKCEECGRPGQWVTDPYLEEIHEIEELRALCPECERERARET